MKSTSQPTTSRVDMKIYYREAYEIQNACNSSGLIFSLARAINAVCDEAHDLGRGTEYKNTHPIVIAYLDKLCSLAGIQAFDARSQAKIMGALETCAKLGGLREQVSQELEQLIQPGGQA